MSKHFECLVIGDLHLNGYKTLFPMHDNPNQYVYDTLKQIYQYARDNGVKTLFYTGDIYDDPHAPIESLIEFIQHLTQHTIFEHHIILGNHDIQREGVHALNLLQYLKTLGLFNNVFIYEKPHWQTFQSFPVCFLPYPFTVTPDKFENDPRFAFVLAHIDVKGSQWENGFSKSTTKPKPKEHWLVGHIHTHHKVGSNVVYSGSLLQTKFSQSLPKGFLHVVATRHKKIEKEILFVPLVPAYELHTHTVLKPQDLNFKYKTDKKRPMLYRLMLKNDVMLPVNYRAKYPQIVKVEGEKQKIDETDLKTFETIQRDNAPTRKNIINAALKYPSVARLSSEKQKRAATILGSILDKLAK